MHGLATALLVELGDVSDVGLDWVGFLVLGCSLGGGLGGSGGSGAVFLLVLHAGGFGFFESLGVEAGFVVRVKIAGLEAMIRCDVGAAIGHAAGAGVSSVRNGTLLRARGGSEGGVRISIRGGDELGVHVCLKLVHELVEIRGVALCNVLDYVVDLGMEELLADTIEVDGFGDVDDLDVAVELRVSGAEVCCESDDTCINAFCILLVVFIALSVIKEFDSAIELGSIVAS